MEPEIIHIYTEADSKSSLLAEVHRLQASLAAMRQARDFHGANSAERMRQVDRLEEQVRELTAAMAGCTDCGHNVDTHDEEDGGCMVNDCRCAGWAAPKL